MVTCLYVRVELYTKDRMVNVGRTNEGPEVLVKSCKTLRVTLKLRKHVIVDTER